MCFHYTTASRPMGTLLTPVTPYQSNDQNLVVRRLPPDPDVAEFVTLETEMLRSEASVSKMYIDTGGDKMVTRMNGN